MPRFLSVVDRLQTGGLLSIEAEVVHFLAGWSIHLCVLQQHFLQIGGVAFLGGEAEEMEQSPAPPGSSELFGGT